jgi:hypothetical protein
MNATRMMAAVVVYQLLVVVAGLPNLLVPEAQAFRGRGAAFAIGAAAGSASASSTEAKPAQPPVAPAPAPAAAPAAPLPLGTVVPSLPAGCVPTPVGGVNYYYCGGNFYKAVYEGSTLKYITAKPE